MVLKLGELFSGPGGLALGAIHSKVETADIIYSIQHEWANDYNSDSCKTYIRNICQDRPYSVICEDVRHINFLHLSPIDIFAYGFPCNDFSIVGEQKGFDGIFGPLYTYGVKILNNFKPRIFVAENVGGITSANEGRAFETILNDLKQAGNGYNITPHLYKAEEYGIPQTRWRLIIVGFDKDLNLFFKIPKPTTQSNPMTAREALENPPIPSGAPNNDFTLQSKIVIERLKNTKPWENAWTADLPAHLRLNVKGAKLSQIYRRLHPDKPSYTITGSGGGGTHGYHYYEPRALTNRERARLQSFPDDFVFEGSKESVRKQIGMAVPPKLSEIIFTSILKTLANIQYPSIISNNFEQLELVG
ncbi:MAG: DNA (cytosine-5-)-methyltransferase [Nitrospirae bacterium]|nr:DNA (cytosine-5-)-methyltransferase [Nitrospirota bacterium]